MFKLTKAGMLYILTSIIFIIFQIFFNQNPIDVNLDTNIMEQQKTDLEEESKEKNLEGTNPNEVWMLEIPKISLKAEIAEGTTKGSQISRSCRSTTQILSAFQQERIQRYRGTIRLQRGFIMDIHIVVFQIMQKAVF